jgi:hypothetical protein
MIRLKKLRVLFNLENITNKLRVLFNKLLTHGIF